MKKMKSKMLLSAHKKLSEAAIREARHKAEIILKDAQMKADEKSCFHC